MIEPTQILLFVVVVVLTSLTVIIGWQIYLIFSEIRKMLSKFNLMADGAVNMTQSLGRSFQNLNGFSDGLKTVLRAFKIFKKKDSAKKINTKEDNEDE